MIDGDSLMTPPGVYGAIERAFGRPALDPCWHPHSPVRPLVAGMLKRNFVGHKGVRRRTFPLVIDHETAGTLAGAIEPDRWAETWPSCAIRGWVYGYGPPRPRWCSGYAFLNPPYSDPAPWLRAAAEAGAQGFPTVALIKADPSTSWWRHWVWHRGVSHLGFFRSRLKYPRTDGGRQYAANFPSALVVYGRWPGHRGVALDLDIKWVLSTIHDTSPGAGTEPRAAVQLDLGDRAD